MKIKLALLCLFTANAATASNKWDSIGHADNVVAMAATNGQLFAASRDNTLWVRAPVPRNVAWKNIGHAQNVVAMAAINGKLFAASKDNKPFSIARLVSSSFLDISNIFLST